LRHEQTVLSPHKLGENAGSLFANRSARHRGDRAQHGARKDAAKVAAARHEISVRYAWHAKRRRAGLTRNHLLNIIRLRELERIFQRRYGLMLPNDDAGREDFLLAANQIAHMPCDIVRHVVSWAFRWAPWMPRAEAEESAKMVADRPLRYTATQLGELLNLTDDERTRLCITTIRAIGVSGDMLAQRRRDRDRERKRHNRAQRRNAKPAPLSKSKPWQLRGISRATWYRRRNQIETKHVRSNIPPIVGDEIRLTSEEDCIQEIES